MKKILAAAGLAAATLLVSAAPAMAGVNPLLNHPDYYESDGVTCEKWEYRDGTHHFMAPDGAVLVVIKAGQMVTEYEGTDLDDLLHSDKDISFVIVCDGDGGPVS